MAYNARCLCVGAPIIVKPKGEDPGICGHLTFQNKFWSKSPRSVVHYRSFSVYCYDSLTHLPSFLISLNDFVYSEANNMNKSRE